MSKAASTRAVIMAGGEGTRLRPFTHTIPKPLLPIGRKPVAQIIVERLRECAFSDIVFSLQYGGDLIRAFFQDGRQFGVRIGYYTEPRKLGTAGCLAHIPELREAAFLVTNGDILTDLDYADLLRTHAQSGSMLTMATRTERTTIPYGVVRLDGTRVTGIEEKPTIEHCFNAGVYAVSPQAIDLIPGDGPFDMTDLVQAVVRTGGLVQAYPLAGLWFDLAKVDDFEKALATIEQLRPELL